MTSGQDESEPTSQPWEHSSHQAFFEYYRDESTSKQTFERFKSIRRTLLRVLAEDRGEKTTELEVADIGCGAGTQCMLWAELGHKVHGLDVNEPLVELARQRTEQMGITARFEVGSATNLPFEDQSMDVCILPELLEHVRDWQRVLDECARILRPQGILYLSTTNKLSPVQYEFRLPLYSWYPGPAKRYVEKLSKTTQPWLAGYATYPAVNWFTPFQLQRELKARGLEPKDNFTVMDPTDFNSIKTVVASAIQRISLLKRLALAALPYSTIFAIKR